MAGVLVRDGKKFTVTIYADGSSEEQETRAADGDVSSYTYTERMDTSRPRMNVNLIC